jgi:hypothetical protein
MTPVHAGDATLLCNRHHVLIYRPEPASRMLRVTSAQGSRRVAELTRESHRSVGNHSGLYRHTDRRSGLGGQAGSRDKRHLLGYHASPDGRMSYSLSSHSGAAHPI